MCYYEVLKKVLLLIRFPEAGMRQENSSSSMVSVKQAAETPLYKLLFLIIKTFYKMLEYFLFLKLFLFFKFACLL